MIDRKDVKIAFHTLGCKLNFSESAQLAQLSNQNGFKTTMNLDEVADVYVINTCSVTEQAEKECHYLVRKLKRQSPESVVVVTGCYAQLQPLKIQKMEGVDMVLGVSEKFQLVKHISDFLNEPIRPEWGCHINEIEEFNAAISWESRTRAFLKVQDGCDYSCSFCTIPKARGKSRSDTIENVIKHISQLVGLGTKEIILTGINLGDFVCGQTGKDFFNLLQCIEKHETKEVRFRISSIEPNLLKDDIIQLVANSQKFVSHFHIPLQSGSDRILGLMRRRYLTKLYEDRILSIKKYMPDCAIGVDVICGFPSENENDFQTTYSFLERLPISYLHVFTYSERPETKALDIAPSVPLATRKKYNHMFRLLSAQKQNAFRLSQKGKIRKVLFEAKETKHEKMKGYTDNYLLVETDYNPTLVNQFVEWEV